MDVAAGVVEGDLGARFRGGAEAPSAAAGVGLEPLVAGDSLHVTGDQSGTVVAAVGDGTERAGGGRRLRAGGSAGRRGRGDGAVAHLVAEEVQHRLPGIE